MNFEEIKLEEMEIHPTKVRWIRKNYVRCLADSIQQQGLLTPLVVVKKEEKYQVLSGAHRMQALKQLNERTAPCVVFCDGEASEILTKILHLDGKQRTTNALQEGQLLYKLMDLGYTQLEMAEIVGKSPSWIQHRLALVVSLAKEVQSLVANESLPPRKAQTIARLPVEKQEAFAWKVREERLSVNEVDQLVAMFNDEKTDEGMKNCILKTPRLALQTSRIKPKKGVAGDVRNMCYSIGLFKQELQDIKNLLSCRKGVTTVERKELGRYIGEAEQLLGEIRNLIKKTGERSHEKV